jgi:tRNA nucleotidyltransferase (CCA-adding enzyme)
VTGSGLPVLADLPREVIEIAATLERAGFETWCVGGALRDRLLGFPAQDVDLATAAPPEDVQRLFPRTVAVGLKHGTVGVLDRNRVLHEVTTFRKDLETDGRHAVVAYGASLEEDLARRDFTLNALAYHPTRQEWRDPHGGAGDLARKLIRAVGDPASRFAEDYLRILRAIRFAARFGFAIDPETWAAARAAAPGLAGLSAERVRDEWFKGLLSAQSLAEWQRLWRQVGAAEIWMPELASDFPFALENPGERDPVVLTAGLVTDPGAVLSRLRASGAEIGRAHAMQRLPRSPASDEPPAVRRWMAETGTAAEDLAALARLQALHEPRWIPVMAGVIARGEATSRAQLAVDGNDLRELGVPPGPELGRMLDELLRAVLDDPSRNTRDTLLAMARQWR